MNRLLLMIVLCAASLNTQAQDTLYNRSDKAGKRQGQWILRYPAGMGEDAYSEWGSYDHGEKWGAWYRFDRDAEVTAVEHFRADVRDGEAKYFERGALVCAGNYRGLNPHQAYDTIWVYDPSKDMEVQRIIPTEIGSVKHGLWRFYDAQTGRVTREIDYVLDEPVARQDFVVAKNDSAWYKRAAQIIEYEKAHPYKPPRGKQHSYLNTK